MSSKQKQNQKTKAKRSGPNPPRGSTKNNKGNTVIGKLVKAPSAQSRKLQSKGPIQTLLKNGGMRIEMEELVMPIGKPATSSVPDTGLLQIARLRANPGSLAMFNWLSGIAPSWEHYKFLKLELHYLTRASTDTRGSLIMSPDYDAEDGSIAVSERALFSNKGTSDEALWKNHVLRLNPAAMNRLYKAHPVMSDERFSSTDQDQKTVDAGQIFICLDVDTLLAQKYGKLVVKYIVELTEPQNPTDPASKGGAIYRKNSSILPNSDAPITAAMQVGTEIKSDVGVLQPAINLPSLTYPTAVIGQFIKDYSGTLNSKSVGTGISANQQFYVSPAKNLNLPAGSVDDVSAPFSSLFSSYWSTTQTHDYHNIVAKAGDLLKIRTGPASTLTQLAGILGGLQTLSLDL